MIFLPRIASRYQRRISRSCPAFIRFNTLSQAVLRSTISPVPVCGFACWCLRSIGCAHRAVFEFCAVEGCGRAAIRFAIHAMISERDHALRPLMAVASPILKDLGNWPSFSRRWRVDGCRRVSALHSRSRTNSYIISSHRKFISVTLSRSIRKPGAGLLVDNQKSNDHTSFPTSYELPSAIRRELLQHRACGADDEVNKMSRGSTPSLTVARCRPSMNFGHPQVTQRCQVRVAPLVSLSSFLGKRPVVCRDQPRRVFQLLDLIDNGNIFVTGLNAV